MAANAEVLADLLVERRAAPATVVGHSYGGGIAILLAARRPEVVSGLVLAGSVGRADSINVVDRLLALPWAGEAALRRRLGGPVRGPAPATGPGRPGPGPRPGLGGGQPARRATTSRWRRTFGRRTWRSFVAEQRFLLREIGDVEKRRWPGSGVPTVVIPGTWDVVVPPSVAASVAAAMAGSRAGGPWPGPGTSSPGTRPRDRAGAVRRVEARAAAGNALDPEAWAEADDTGA